MPYSTEAPSPFRTPVLFYGYPYPITEKNVVNITYKHPVTHETLSVIRKSRVIMRNFDGWRIQVLGRWATIPRYVSDFSEAIRFHELESKRLDRLFDEEFGDGVEGLA